MKPRLKFPLLILITFFSGLLSRKVEAQVSSTGIAITTQVNDTAAQDGDILCTYSQGIARCNQEYDSAILGVINENPSSSIEDSEVEDGRLVLTSGVSTVRVSSVNGNIEEGDLVTTSENPGVGMKATRNGYVLGIAMESFKSDNPQDVGRIQVIINVHATAGLSGPRGNLLQFIRQGLTVPVFGPVESLRYLLAVAIVIISFTLGMIYFGRASRTGIEAIGRNPLAKRVIQMTVILNITLTIVIVIVGLGIAYLILVL